MGKIIKYCCIICSLCLLTLLTDIEGEAARKKFVLEQTSATAPDVTAYIGGTYSGKWDDLSFDATISNDGNEIPLSQTEISSFAKSGEGIHYIVLVDNSGSVDKKQLEQAKKELNTLKKELGENDRLTIYTVGTKSKSGSKKKVSSVSAIKNGAKYTVLYRSLNEIIAEQASVSMRTVVLLVTDGEDDSEGKDNNISNTVENTKNASIPIYGVLLKNTLSKKNKEKMKATENQILANSRGDYEKCSSVKDVKNAFRSIKKMIQKETYVVKFKAATNKKLDGISKIKISTVENALEGNIDYSRNTEDNEPPYFAGDITKTGDNAIRFSIGDNEGAVAGAGEKENYIVKSLAKGKDTPDEDAKVWTVKAVNYNENTNEVELTFEEDLYTGDYYLSTNNITDDSQEKNVMTETKVFSIEGQSPVKAKIRNTVKNYWWILVILVIIIIGIIVIFVIKHRKPVIIHEGGNPEDVITPDSKLIKLTITDRAGQVKEVEWNVEGSIFIGRSDMCNIFFDDDRLSRQHFAIEVTKVACYIEDLETTNGTFVNGVRLNARRMLLNNDVITAGRERFVFQTLTESSDTEQNNETAGEV